MVHERAFKGLKQDLGEDPRSFLSNCFRKTIPGSVFLSKFERCGKLVTHGRPNGSCLGQPAAPQSTSLSCLKTFNLHGSSMLQFASCPGQVCDMSDVSFFVFDDFLQQF